MKAKSFLLVLFTLLLFVGLYARCEVAANISFLPQSRIDIHGSSNVNTFTFSQNIGKESLNAFILKNHYEETFLVRESSLSLRMLDFECRNKAMHRDFLKMTKANEFPEMYIRLKSVRLDSIGFGSMGKKGLATVSITLAGVEHEYKMFFSYDDEQDWIQITGSKELNLRDFGLVPPTKFMKLIRVNEKVEVSFTLFISIVSK